MKKLKFLSQQAPAKQRRNDAMTKARNLITTVWCALIGTPNPQQKTRFRVISAEVVLMRTAPLMKELAAFLR